MDTTMIFRISSALVTSPHVYLGTMEAMVGWQWQREGMTGDLVDGVGGRKETEERLEGPKKKIAPESVPDRHRSSL